MAEKVEVKVKRGLNLGCFGCLIEVFAILLVLYILGWHGPLEWTIGKLQEVWNLWQSSPM